METVGTGWTSCFGCTSAGPAPGPGDASAARHRPEAWSGAACDLAGPILGTAAGNRTVRRPGGVYHRPRARQPIPLSGDPPVVADPYRPTGPRRWLDGHEIQANREVRQVGPVGKPARFEQPTDARPEMDQLAPVDRFLRQPEVA